MKTEIDDKYIRGLCRHFGVDFDQFVALLRGEKPKEPASAHEPRSTSDSEPPGG
jgi:hypothetical protein